MLEFNPSRIHRKLPTKFPTKEEIYEQFRGFEQLNRFGLVVDRSGSQCMRKRTNGTRCNGKLRFNASHTKWTCLVRYDPMNIGDPCKVPFSVYHGSLFEGLRSEVRPEQVLLIARHLLEGYSIEQSLQEVKVSRRTIWFWRTKVKNVLAAARISEVN